MLDDPDTTQLVCPECGTEKFSWNVTQVQFGRPFERNDNRSEIGDKMGPIVGDDVTEDGLFCTGCEERFDREELVPKNGHNDRNPEYTVDLEEFTK